ncbi:hypothetical protein [Kitasatospora nipponensis]|uniref:hypothetical protein n=1 Tax=Kitasatospora nipponensis TaxID=258049 RepID=UPI0031DAA2F7
MTVRRRALALCATVVAALVGVAFLAPLPFTKTEPGRTADVLGSYEDHQVITITGAAVRPTTGALRVTTISASLPNQSLSFTDALAGWVDPKVAILPREAVYPQGNPEKANQETSREMTQAQDSATTAALNYLHLSPDQVKVSIDLGDIGGPSGGQMISLGIIDKLVGDGHGGDLTGGRDIAGTGTISDDGTVGVVGGVALKTHGAAQAGATVFLLPRAECSEAQVNTPAGLRLVPVATLADALGALTALNGGGGTVPSC